MNKEQKKQLYKDVAGIALQAAVYIFAAIGFETVFRYLVGV
jgi:hypothetical protein